jgi:iron complex transport system substrate-binding protein
MAEREYPRVYWEEDQALVSPGPGTLVYDVIETAGGQSVTTGAATPWVQFDVTGLVRLDPQVILLANEAITPAVASARPGWDGVSAVRTGRVFAIRDEVVFARPGPRLIEGIEFLVQVFYPDLAP